MKNKCPDCSGTKEITISTGYGANYAEGKIPCPMCMNTTIKNDGQLFDFILESNKIEGINSVNKDELTAYDKFLSLDNIKVENLEKLVSVIQPGAKLRLEQGMNVYVGVHTPPPGGPAIGYVLQSILSLVNRMNYKSDLMAYEVHKQYENLHPFMDGNGRSGRALWLWMMGGLKKAPLGFLHHWYYQSLQYGGPR